MSIIGEFRNRAFNPVVKRLRKDYTVEDTDDISVVKILTKEGDYYIPRRCLSDATDIRLEQFKGHPHKYECCGTELNSKDIVIDLGASDGAFTLHASKVAFKVYALEPHPLFAKLLRKTFEKTPNVSVLELGASNQKKDAYIAECMFASATKEDCPAEGYKIKIDTLDNLFFDITTISYIKCDIEGEEYNMLKGAEKIIKRDKPKIAICVYHDKEDPERIERLLKEYVPEYKIKIIKDTVLHAYID